MFTSLLTSHCIQRWTWRSKLSFNILVGYISWVIWSFNHNRLLVRACAY